MQKITMENGLNTRTDKSIDMIVLIENNEFHYCSSMKIDFIQEDESLRLGVLGRILWVISLPNLSSSSSLKSTGALTSGPQCMLCFN